MKIFERGTSQGVDVWIPMTPKVICYEERGSIYRVTAAVLLLVIVADNNCTLSSCVCLTSVARGRRTVMAV